MLTLNSVVKLFSYAYTQFCRKVKQQQEILIDSYAAENLEEFLQFSAKYILNFHSSYVKIFRLFTHIEYCFIVQTQQNVGNNQLFFLQ